MIAVARTSLQRSWRPTRPVPTSKRARRASAGRSSTQWQIPAGARVLEIGCGQGDTTAVLADAVGSAGRVIAVDIADPSYGAPVTIGESARHLSDGPARAPG